jgi:hypothetical protein
LHSAHPDEGAEIQHRFVANGTEMTLEDDEGPGELRICWKMLWPSWEKAQDFLVNQPWINGNFRIHFYGDMESVPPI